MRVTTQGARQEVLEHFKGYFAGASGSSHSWSSSASWAESDLWGYARSAATNAPLFIEAFYDACRTFATDDDTWAPDADMINELLTKHRIGYLIQPPRLEAREDATPIIAVAPLPASLAESAAEVLQRSLARAEELLSEGRGREAVQESLWLLETVTTAFRGVETATGSIEGKYFNQIVRELRDADSGGTLKRVLEWIVALHGYLSSPTGGGVRHGLDLNDGVPIVESDAQLFCNLIRSYLSFLLVEYHRMTGK